MKGFAKVSVDKVSKSIRNYNKLKADLEALEKSLEPEITRQVSEWGWYARWSCEVTKRGAVGAWMMRYNFMFDSSFDTYVQHGLVTEEQSTQYSNVLYSSNQKSDLESLVDASTDGEVHINEGLSSFVNYFQEEISIE